MRRIRLVTLILLIVIIAQGLALYVQHRRAEQLRSALLLYRNHAQEEMLDTLEEEYDFAETGWGPAYGKAMPLEDVLMMVKRRTKGTWLPKGFPIYVDPVGLEEAGKTMTSPVGTEPAKGPLRLGDHLRRILKPMGLAYEVKYGLLMITSEEATDAPRRDARERDLTREELYRRYRNVLR